MVPSRPFWKSSKAVITSALVFITNGPAQATGSRIGWPPSTITSMAGVRLSWLPDACTVTKSPAARTARLPVCTATLSSPTVPRPERT